MARDTGYTGLGSPSNPGQQAAGQLFIHELTHVWQIHHSNFLPGTMCTALVDQSTTLSNNMGIYTYGPPGPAWASFNLEQQASIVDDWFAGVLGTRPPMSEGDSYFRDIRDNIRVGIT